MGKKFIRLKDVILITLLTALCLVICTVVVLPFSANIKLVLWLVSGIEVLLCGPIYTLMCAKAPRRGTMILFAFLFAVYYYFTNSMIVISLMIFAIGILMELIVLGDGYRNPARLSIALSIFGVGIMMSPVVLMFSSKTSLAETMLASGLTQEYIDSVFSVYSVTNILIGVVVTIIGAVTGCLLGYRLMKKHFAPAGIVVEE